MSLLVSTSSVKECSNEAGRDVFLACLLSLGGGELLPEVGKDRNGALAGSMPLGLGVAAGCRGLRENGTGAAVVRWTLAKRP